MDLLRKIGKLLWKDKPNNLFTLVLAILASLTSFFSSQKQINDFKAQIDQKLINTQSQTQTVITSQNTPESQPKNNNVQGKTATRSFNFTDWLFARNIEPDKEGYYCPFSIPFQGWFMWTKNKYIADQGMSLTFQLKDKTDNNKNPTLQLSYGDKTNNAPDTYYRFNILDGDLNTIRLYDRKSKDVEFERSIHEPTVENFLTFKIAPIFTKKTTSALLLNPSLSYFAEGVSENFEPNKEFKINLPFPSKDDQGQGAQYGIGVSGGDCFKIISYEF